MNVKSMRKIHFSRSIKVLFYLNIATFSSTISWPFNNPWNYLKKLSKIMKLRRTKDIYSSLLSLVHFKQKIHVIQFILYSIVISIREYISNFKWVQKLQLTKTHFYSILEVIGYRTWWFWLKNNVNKVGKVTL